MSFTLDANILLYAVDERSPRHREARDFLDRVTAGYQLIYLFWPTVMAYVRIATNPAVFDQPLSLDEAVFNVDAVLALAHVQTAGERERFWNEFREVADESAARGNLLSDAHIVALMRENGVRTIWTHDRDYRRFRGIEVRDPFD